MLAATVTARAQTEASPRSTLLHGGSRAIGADAVRALKRATGLNDFSSGEIPSGRLPPPYHKLVQSNTTVQGQNAASPVQHQVPEPMVETARMIDMSYLTDLRVFQQGMPPASSLVVPHACR